MENTRIIELCADGDKDAMEQLYRRYAHRMMRIIKRYIADEAAAEDVLHDGFVVVYTRIGEVRSHDRLEYWMGTIMKNLCLNYLKQLDLTTILNEETDMPDVPEMEDILSYEELEDIINHLPDGYRRIFKLAVLENKSHKEIGRILGIAPNTSSSQLYHAKVLLRKMIREKKSQMGVVVLVLLSFLAWILRTGEGDASPNVDEPLISESLKPGEKEMLPTVDKVIGRHRITTNRESSDMADSVTYTCDTASVSTPEEEVQSVEEISTSNCRIENQPKQMEWGAKKYVEESGRKSGEWMASLHYSVNGGRPRPDQANSDYGYDTDTNSPGDSDKPNNPGGEQTSVLREVSCDMPVSVGVRFSRSISDRLNIETGLYYTGLKTRIRYHSKHFESRVNYRANYIGVPLMINCRLLQWSRLSVYAAVGGAVEIPVGVNVSERRIKDDRSVLIPELSAKTQWSVSAGLGLQLSISSKVGLYTEPSVRYNFNNHSTLPTYWQENPTSIAVPIGIRISW